MPASNIHCPGAPARPICLPLTPDRTGDSSHEIIPCPGCKSGQERVLMEFFDVKLFLLTFKDVAKARRFSRTPYMDFPYGGRTEGQYWKTEGYFDGVAWPNYERSHSWLLTDGKDKEGINTNLTMSSIQFVKSMALESEVDTGEMAMCPYER